VDPPLALLGISMAGGLVGGYVFMLKRRRTKRWRVPLGALTGVMLFWAILFLGLSALPRTTILNPISIFVISVLGGWMGTGVFDPILKRLGLGTS
jgi:ABC-type transport system involved in cytochrome c biogenesis permease subunit